ncbi:type A2 lanthipeptide [Staphylococcus pettenkoferi]|uniref:type A2 lanthipeptide n=1 Tax=Staphylococcus pettenkoferi TaxID=170573 RepID=UPI0022734E10|nr:type A2 lanthipeptide [Staphylococcus pettenkoferi]MCY1597419.1 type A2 lanthipeptide [Staphylococcus pettenkoferi]
MQRNAEVLALEAIDNVSDEELETLVGAGGIVPTLTKDCPETVSGVDISAGPVSVSKNCD